MRHTTGSVYAVFDKPVHMYRGTTMAGIVRDEARNDPKRGFVGGYEMETLSLGLPFMAAFLNPGAWGRSFTSAHRRLFQHGRPVDRRRGHAAGDQPRHARSEGEGRQRHAGRERAFRRPCERRAMRKHAYRQGAAIYEAVGAVRTFPTPPYPSTHNLGTNRMSANARDGVVNKWGQTHDVKNLFVVGWQPVHHRCRVQPDPDHRRTGDPPGRRDGRHDEPKGDLTPGAVDRPASPSLLDRPPLPRRINPGKDGG